MMRLLTLAILAGGPPLAEEHFRQEERILSHFLLVVDVASERRIRADDLAACESELAPAGETAWIPFALAALEEGVLDPSDRIACDSLCWAEGRHGRPSVSEAIAHSCETFFLRAAERVEEELVTEHAEAAGFAPEGRWGELDPESGRFRSEWTVTAREWVDFWRRIASGAGSQSVETASTLLGAAALSVSSPRGAARALWSQDPRIRVRAIAGSSPEGSWVTGSLEADGRHRWVFALHVRGGTSTLAAERAARLLEETVDGFRRSSLERGGEPLPSFRE